MLEHEITLIVNDQQHKFKVGDLAEKVNPSHTLAHTLRETLGLTGTKVGCNKGECCSCTVLIEGKPVLSCMILTIECDGKIITTIEGLEEPKTGELDPIQQSFVENGAFQCGFCTPGIIMSTKALLKDKPSPTKQDIKEALSGHYCRCISHYHVLDAVAKCACKGE
ncbi:MAG: (2Fe-2S)-binding protein [Clostridia bacterium]|jgi:aerobic-type carbon monoxide dehydrogenase small subunit (CoxS/CutS family)|nr:(2Fe-2S)-binding protein [Clostridia bacterium]